MFEWKEFKNLEPNKDLKAYWEGYCKQSDVSDLIKNEKFSKLKGDIDKSFESLKSADKNSADYKKAVASIEKDIISLTEKMMGEKCAQIKSKCEDYLSRDEIGNLNKESYETKEFYNSKIEIEKLLREINETVTKGASFEKFKKLYDNTEKMLNKFEDVVEKTEIRVAERKENIIQEIKALMTNEKEYESYVGEIKKLARDFQDIIINEIVEICVGNGSLMRHNHYIKDNFNSLEEALRDYRKFKEFDYEDTTKNSIGDLLNFRDAIEGMSELVGSAYLYGCNFLKLNSGEVADVKKLKLGKSIEDGRGDFEKDYERFEQLKKKNGENKIQGGYSDKSGVKLFVELYNKSLERRNNKDTDEIDAKLKEISIKRSKINEKYVTCRKALNKVKLSYRNVIIEYIDKYFEEKGKNKDRIKFSNCASAMKFMDDCRKNLSGMIHGDMTQCEVVEESLKASEKILDWIIFYGLRFLQDELNIKGVYSNVTVGYAARGLTYFGFTDYGGAIGKFKTILSRSQNQGKDLNVNSTDDTIVKMFIKLYNVYTDENQTTTQNQNHSENGQTTSSDMRVMATKLQGKKEEIVRKYNELFSKIPSEYYDVVYRKYIEGHYKFIEICNRAQRYIDDIKNCNEVSDKEKDNYKKANESLDTMRKIVDIIGYYIFRFLDEEIGYKNGIYKNYRFFSKEITNAGYDKFIEGFKKSKNERLTKNKGNKPLEKGNDEATNMLVGIYNESGLWKHIVKTLKDKVDASISSKRVWDVDISQKSKDAAALLRSFIEEVQEANKTDQNLEKEFCMYSKKSLKACLENHVLKNRSKNSLLFSKSNDFAKKMIKLIDKSTKISHNSKKIYDTLSDNKEYALNTAKKAKKSLKIFIRNKAYTKDDPSAYLLKKNVQLSKALEECLKDCKKNAKGYEVKEVVKAVPKWDSVLKSAKDFNKEVVKFNSDLEMLANKYDGQKIDKGVPMFADRELNEVLRDIMSEISYCLFWGIYGYMVCYFSNTIGYNIASRVNIEGLEELNAVVNEAQWD